MQIILRDLPKISLNVWYSSSHWSKRKKIKDAYKIIVKNQFKDVLSKDKQYHVNYSFEFTKRPLDATNCTAMVKMIEDIIFEDDNYKIIKSITIESMKSHQDLVYIEITQLNK